MEYGVWSVVYYPMCMHVVCCAVDGSAVCVHSLHQPPTPPCMACDMRLGPDETAAPIDRVGD
jgi:hypothetical protein